MARKKSKKRAKKDWASGYAVHRIEELKRRRTARNAARERVLMRVSDGAVVVNDGSSGVPN